MTPEFNLSAYLGIPAWLIAIILVWILAWKGIALWKSARNNHLIWFIVLLLVNTIGILEILYIFIFSRLGRKKKRRK